MNCGREGSIAILAAVPAGMVMDPGADVDPQDPVLVVVTACRQHLKAVRAWIRMRTPEEPITLSTDALMHNWGQIVDPIELPVYSPLAV